MTTHVSQPVSENQSIGDSPTGRISVNWRQTHYKSCSQNSRQPAPTRVVSDKTHFPRGWWPTPASAAHSNRAVKRTTIPFCPYAQHNAKRTLSRSPTEGRQFSFLSQTLHDSHSPSLCGLQTDTRVQKMPCTHIPFVLQICCRLSLLKMSTHWICTIVVTTCFLFQTIDL